MCTNLWRAKTRIRFSKESFLFKMTFLRPVRKCRAAGKEIFFSSLAPFLTGPFNGQALDAYREAEVQFVM